MKKILIFLLFVSQLGNAQYNLFARQNFAKSASAPTYNTYIGGVSATISTSSALATKLGISSGRISNFTVVGSDIKCKVTGGSYAIGANAFEDDANITYYDDPEGLVTSIGYRAFRGVNIIGSSKLIRLTLKNATLLDTQCLQYRNDCEIYIPNALTFVTDPLVGTNRSLIYCNSYLATNNGGGIDASIASAISSGATVRFITNYTAPSPVTTLAAGTIYNTAIQLNFTPPSSTNTIDYYDCYANGVLKNRINGSGGYISGLTQNTNYNITVVAVDIFYNKSIVSNTVNTTTANNSWDIATGLISYYKLDYNSNDNLRTNNGTDTSVSYVSGKIGNAGSYNGSSSRTVIGNPTNLKLSTLSISCWIKSSGAGSGYRSILSKRYAYNLYFNSNVLVTYSYGSPVGEKSTSTNISDGTWKHLVLVQQSGVTNGTKIYINGVLVLTTTVGQTAQTDNIFFGFDTDASGYTNYILDETSIYNTVLTQSDIDILYNSGTGTTL